MNAAAQAPASALGWIESIAIDVARKSGVLRLKNGQSASMPLDFPDTDEQPAITHMLYSFADYTVEITALTGEKAVIEVGLPGQEAQISGRRVVYLDQGHWSALARHHYAPAGQSGAEVAAADKLIGWVQAGQIILPLSSGHVMETTPLYGAKRQRLAFTMLKLSRGWHMRNPVLVRRDEIARAIGTNGPGAETRHAVFTLDPDTLYIDGPVPPAPAGLPAYLGWLRQRLTSVAANFDLLVDAERIPPDKTSTWCDYLAALGRSSEFRALSTARRRAKARVEALGDAVAETSVQTELQRAGLSPHQAADALVTGLQEHPETMPFLRLYADALGVRLLDPMTKWVPNDLIDMLYLGCAAAYADAVAAERTATRYLSAAWPDGRGSCPVVPTLSELVTVLESMGLE